MRQNNGESNKGKTKFVDLKYGKTKYIDEQIIYNRKELMKPKMLES